MWLDLTLLKTVMKIYYSVYILIFYQTVVFFFVDTQAKKRMVRDLKPQIGENLFDGAMLFTLKWLPDPCVHTVKNEVSS